jgi:hypothetical protein
MRASHQVIFNTLYFRGSLSQGRSKQFVLYGPESKIFFGCKQNFRQKSIAPSSLKMPPFHRMCFHCFWKGGTTIEGGAGGPGVIWWYFCQICAPFTTALQAAAHCHPPLWSYHQSILSFPYILFWTNWSYL